MSRATAASVVVVPPRTDPAAACTYTRWEGLRRCAALAPYLPDGVEKRDARASQTRDFRRKSHDARYLRGPAPESMRSNSSTLGSRGATFPSEGSRGGTRRAHKGRCHVMTAQQRARCGPCKAPRPREGDVSDRIKRRGAGARPPGVAGGWGTKKGVSTRSHHSRRCPPCRTWSGPPRGPCPVVRRSGRTPPARWCSIHPYPPCGRACKFRRPEAHKTAGRGANSRKAQPPTSALENERRLMQSGPRQATLTERPRRDTRNIRSVRVALGRPGATEQRVTSGLRQAGVAAHLTLGSRQPGYTVSRSPCSSRGRCRVHPTGHTSRNRRAPPEAPSSGDNERQAPALPDPAKREVLGVYRPRLQHRG